MFARIKKTRDHRYLQIVENRRAGQQTVQRVLVTLGSVDKLANKTLAALRASMIRVIAQIEEERRKKDRRRSKERSYDAFIDTLS
jgi:hypothetical protein